MGLSVFVWVACSHQGESHQSSPSKSFTEIKVQETSAEIKLPFQIWDLIEGKSVEETKTMQKERDTKDKSREVAPLQVPEGSHVIDTTGMSLSEVIDKVYGLVKSSL